MIVLDPRVARPTRALIEACIRDQRRAKQENAARELAQKLTTNPPPEGLT